MKRPIESVPCILDTARRRRESHVLLRYSSLHSNNVVYAAISEKIVMVNSRYWNRKELRVQSLMNDFDEPALRMQSQC